MSHHRRQDTGEIRSVGGVTVGNAWLRNNPGLDYPDDHESMSDSDLKLALKSDLGEESVTSKRRA